ncbi:MAG: hypothetical protein A3C30_01675 [Candidatus Levybacteria bacterium RIFCSPHIGHO2_02_FULL_40_18]|nr:MAG: hypothetical protein A2869_01240 [Candidatus Levybacteria bacterium RIFCSPHIGHO2_01_FULL_40_58]OGH26702.1 MAG: hypothetical protein A3C30_01675 [Candidatus Levybacteria bacterium RIFCSPHIGHO2_02_FULL_40_18]OGH40265.1 MAG: hypothetical protein A2894_02410 [Candidatus Levybacteria bacterium RIFCSPLOWO2_01_FULL_40_64]OGH48713.1 MAG: hypothetical protein A3I54_03570 [Candidatus Levybacteria bacterium RIFCSPLOWO2_02_FULL_41_11]OGH53256.1 MAG: hypothetical protein A3G15_04510 [Candidatus Levy
MRSYPKGRWSILRGIETLDYEIQGFMEFGDNLSEYGIWKEQVQMDAIRLPKRIGKWESGQLTELTRP